jgi:biotin transport system substrate-specific component
MEYKKMSVRELCYIGIFAAIIAVCAQISIRLGEVPFTLQVWGISLAGLILGPKKGTMSTLVYILLGAVGAPVFANFTGGLGVIAGPTGGFIHSFPILAFLAGLGGKKDSYIWMLGGLTAGNIINLLWGLLFFSQVTGHSLQVSFGYAVLPFIPVTIIKIIILPIISKNIKIAMTKAKVAV